jgi:hypothetical protein
MMRAMVGLALTVLALSIQRPVAAQVEIEADPIAYAVNGYSLHLGYVAGRARLSVGAFGADIPEWLHGNDGWDMTMRGAGIKLDYLGSRLDGIFVGVESGLMRLSYRVGDSPARKRNEVGVGVRGGYRLAIGRSGLYVVPWVGVGYTPGGRDVVIGDARFDHSAVTVFPTVHIGWRF